MTTDQWLTVAKIAGIAGIASLLLAALLKDWVRDQENQKRNPSLRVTPKPIQWRSLAYGFAKGTWGCVWGLVVMVFLLVFVLTAARIAWKLFEFAWS